MAYFHYLLCNLGHVGLSARAESSQLLRGGSNDRPCTNSVGVWELVSSKFMEIISST